MTISLQERVQQAVDAGFSVSQLAQAAGVTVSAASQWLSGNTKTLKAQSAIGLAELTNWTTQWWTSGQGPRDRSEADANMGPAAPVRRMILRRSLAAASDPVPPLPSRSDELAMAVQELDERFQHALPPALQRRDARHSRIQVGGMSRQYDFVSERHVAEMVVFTHTGTSRQRFEPSILRLAVGRALDDSREYLLAIVPLHENMSLPFSTLHSITVDANLLGVKIVLASFPEQVADYIARLEMAPPKADLHGFNDLNPDEIEDPEPN